MTRFISRHNTISPCALKRKEIGTTVVHHNEWETVRFIRVHGGWTRQRLDFTGLRPEVVSSAAVAAECNSAIGCRESWAEVY